MKNLRLSAIVAIALFAFVADAPAKGKGKGKGIKMFPATKVHAGTAASITDVSSTSISVKNDKNSKTYSIDSNTLITIDGKKASADALRSGMSADVTPSGINPNAARSIEASSSK